MNPKQFKELQDKWYKKLEKSGFEDAEDSSGSLKRWSSKFYTARKSDGHGDDSLEDKLAFFKNKEAYYQLAGNFLYVHKFETKLDKAVWTLHAEGSSTREISKALSKATTSIDKSTVDRVIQRLKKLMIAGGVKHD